LCLPWFLSGIVYVLWFRVEVNDIKTEFAVIACRSGLWEPVEKWTRSGASHSGRLALPGATGMLALRRHKFDFKFDLFSTDC
jgi:hypothetical protein